MSDVEITIKLPEELIQRAKAAGIQIENQTEQIIALLEAQIRKQEASQRLRDIMDQADRLPDDIKPTPAEIDAEVRAHRTGKTVQSRRA